MILVGLVTLVAAEGCYERHRGAVPTVPPPVDAGTDAGLRPAVDGSTSSCVSSEATIRVSAEDRLNPFCVGGGFVGYVDSSYAEGEAMVIDVCIGESCGCRITVDGLGEPVRDALLRVMERVHDGHFEFDTRHLLVRNTSLCDGPAPEECPIVIDAETGRLRPRPGTFRVGTRFGETECTGDCGSVRELEFELDLGHRVDAISLRQGEMGNVGASHFANLRSWNSCTDEPDTITWVHWLE